jgi:hypothetical protein
MIRIIGLFSFGLIGLIAAIWSISNTRAGVNRTYLEDLKKMLPAQVYAGDSCEVNVIAGKKWGVQTYSVDVKFAGETPVSSQFEITDNELASQVVQFDHDQEKKHFLKIGVRPTSQSADQSQINKMAIIKSHGELAAVVVKAGTCVLQ